MAVPTSITDCNATAANNSPAGSDSIGTSLDDYLRAHAAILRQVYDASLIPSGTKVPFAQSAAPTGWTQDTTDNSDNRMLRVVKTAGGSVAGSHSPILMNVVPSHTHTITTGNESADHTHTGTTDIASANHTHSIGLTITSGVNSNGIRADRGDGNVNNGSVTSSGVSSDHTHTFTTGVMSASHTHSGTTDGGSSATNWTPRYIDMIICSKN